MTWKPATVALAFIVIVSLLWGAIVAALSYLGQYG